MSKVSYKNIVNKKLDQDTVNWTQLIPTDKWEDPVKRNNEIETIKSNAIKDANDKQFIDPKRDPPIVKFEGQGRPTTRT